MYYSIDDSDGTNICGGIQSRIVAERSAQRHADTFGDVVHVYASNGSEAWDVEPSNAESQA